MNQSKSKLTLGILAHVDAGKTTLSESILFESGITKVMGRVDHKNAFLDTDVQEKERGITIFSKQAIFPSKNFDITLVDTPGHADFSAETERVLEVLDYCVLVISGPDGVKGQVKLLWQLLELHRIPVFIFVNKMDMPDTNASQILQELKKNLSSDCIDFTNINEEFYDQVATCDEEALDYFLNNGEIPADCISSLVKNRKLFPVTFGSALNNHGVIELLDIIDEYAIATNYTDSFGAKLFKISRDKQGNRLSHIKITGGKIKIKDIIGEDKIDQIRIYNGENFEKVNTCDAGTICQVMGLKNSYSGQGLGFEEDFNNPKMCAVMQYDLLYPSELSANQVYEKFSQLSEEIPELMVNWAPGEDRVTLKLMGMIQAEIIKGIALERFNMPVDFGKGSVLYKETILDKTYGMGHFEPLRHYAEVHLLMEPLSAQRGITTGSIVSEDILDKNWQRLITTHLIERQHPGVLIGAPLTDVNILIAAGRAHKKHTEGGDFRQATYRAIRHGLMNAQCQLLEPYYDFTITSPKDVVGRIMGDIKALYGNCEIEQMGEEDAMLTGNGPVSTLNDYPAKLSSFTRGEGQITFTFKGYYPCHNTEEVVEAYGYDPESDVDNPCGSVFCKGGSGFYVPWDEVPDYVHLDNIFEASDNDEPIKEPSRSSSSTASKADLEAIFQMTYGKGQERKAPYKRAAKEIIGTNYVGKKTITYNSSKEECLIIDGYNIIFSSDELKEDAKFNLENARTTLINILQNFAGFTEKKIILVFDGYKRPGNNQSNESYPWIDVVYTKEGQTADQFIEKYVSDNREKYRITVASSDGLEQSLIFGQGALRMPARELNALIKQTEQEIRNTIKNNIK